MTESRSAREIEDFLRGQFSRLLGVRLEELDAARPIVSYGLDSVDLVQLSGDLAQWLGYELPPTLFFEHPTIAALSKELARQTSA
jgi:acyl carrier protein